MPQRIIPLASLRFSHDVAERQNPAYGLASSRLRRHRPRPPHAVRLPERRNAVAPDAVEEVRQRLELEEAKLAEMATELRHLREQAGMRDNDLPNLPGQQPFAPDSLPAFSDFSVPPDLLNHPFSPTPLGADLYVQFGDEFATPKRIPLILNHLAQGGDGNAL